MNVSELLKQDLVPVDNAAAALGIEPKRLRGFIARNSIADPIGDMQRVYGWSCRSLARRAEKSSAADAATADGDNDVL